MNRDVSIEKSKPRKGSNYFPAKLKTSSYFNIAAQNQHTRSQNTYMRSKLHSQVKNGAKIKGLSSWITSLVNAKFIFKINFWHKILFC